VRVVIRREGANLGQGSVVWWASDGTAKADDDFAYFGRRVESFAADETERTIQVPLVVDSIREDRETFFVNLGQGEQAGRRLEPSERIEVSIVDDDF
jgi:hypothetical protein